MRTAWRQAIASHCRVDVAWISTDLENNWLITLKILADNSQLRLNDPSINSRIEILQIKLPITMMNQVISKLPNILLIHYLRFIFLCTCCHIVDFIKTISPEPFLQLLASNQIQRYFKQSCSLLSRYAKGWQLTEWIMLLIKPSWICWTHLSAHAQYQKFSPNWDSLQSTWPPWTDKGHSKTPFFSHLLQFLFNPSNIRPTSRAIHGPFSAQVTVGSILL